METFSVTWWVIIVLASLSLILLGQLFVVLLRNKRKAETLALVAGVAAVGLIIGVSAGGREDSAGVIAHDREIERLEMRAPGADPLKELTAQEDYLAGLSEDDLVSTTRRGRAEETLRIFSITLSTRTEGSICTPPAHRSGDVVLASFCSREPDVIHLDHARTILDRDVDLLEVLRHEIAHRSILLRCGPSVDEGGDRDIDSDRQEQITVAYSDDYLGGRSQQLPEQMSSAYTATEEDHRIAADIRNGICTS